MVNGLGVRGWGVGGIEAEAAMLGQPISMLIPQVVGFRLKGRMLEGATATDLVLTITEKLRKHGVVGKFVEFFGSGLEDLTIADRATLGNMCPEYGATIAIFPIDVMTLDYLRLSGGRVGGTGNRDRARSRRSGHRRDHELHQHLESERDDRRRPGREESRRARPEASAVGEDEPGARLEGRHRVSEESRSRHLS